MVPSLSGDELSFVTNFAAHELICNGVEMRDFKFSKPSASFLNARNSLAELKGKTFYPHFHPKIQVSVNISILICFFAICMCKVLGLVAECISTADGAHMKIF